MPGILNFPKGDFLKKGLVATALTSEGSSGKVWSPWGASRQTRPQTMLARVISL